MATLAPGGRISIEVVEEEIARLRLAWQTQSAGEGGDLVERIVGRERAEEIDYFDRLQLASVLKVCRESRSLSDAGRALFTASRGRKKSVNDADRLRKYLMRFGLEWRQLKDML
jgi:transcriptional regulatory protein RtcR